ncbi:unnamed protein product, partial [Staurois parvus]
SWGSRAIGDHGAPVSLPKLKKAYEKGTRGISGGPLLTLGPQAVPEFPNGQSAPAHRFQARRTTRWEEVTLHADQTRWTMSSLSDGSSLPSEVTTC